MRTEWIAVLVCALGVVDSSCQTSNSSPTCTESCDGPYVTLNVPPDNAADVVGIDASGACSGATCERLLGAACASWQVTLTSTGQCTIHVHHTTAPDDVFTTGVSQLEGCCGGLHADPPFIAVPSLATADAGADAGTGEDAASSCPQTIAQRCAQGDPPAGQFGVHCASSLSAAEHDTALCMTPMVTEATCGTLTVITTTNVDFSYLYYYDASGALSAITSDGLVLGQQCLAGPGTFAIPHAACTTDRLLPACASGDAGAAD